MISEQVIHHYDQHQGQEVETRNWLPAGKITVGITAGASCPNNLIEDTIRRLFRPSWHRRPRIVVNPPVGPTFATLL